ncbi:MAG: AAA family ATPase [Acidimicrobiia bacterium]
MADVASQRERDRQKRLARLGLVLAIPAGWLWWRFLTGQPIFPEFSLPPDAMFWLPGIAIVLLLGAIILLPMLGNGRSPHTIVPPEHIDVSFDDVVGLGEVTNEVRHTLQVLTDHEAYRVRMGGRPRRGVLFEGPPGTGKTHMAKAMAKEAGVPFLFVSATAFQSMWYGATARKIRSFFKALRKQARREGGAIGFIEEIDAIAMSRGGVSAMTPRRGGALSVDRSMMSEGTGGVVNELLVQMQSFDDPSGSEKLAEWFRKKANRFLPPHRQLRAKPIPYTNVLLIAATNRAASLDPALLRPGRFDRVLHFAVPGHSSRRELVDFFLERKSHAAELDEPAPREEIASATLGYSPAMLERLFDEALLLALRDGREALNAADLRRARFETELGLPERVESPDHEIETIATHEAGHATIAYLVGKGRRLEVLSIVKRKEALGFLAHRLSEERHTQTRSEMEAIIQIALGGMVAEELFFGESGTGPAGDLMAATNAAVEMVGSMGLGGSLVSFRALDPGAFGGNLVATVMADDRGRDAVERVLDEQKARVTELMAAHRHLVEALRDALLDRKELVDAEIIEVLHDAEAARLAERIH